MSRLFGRDLFSGDHGRARELAALRLDEPLVAPDVLWLEGHLAGCPDCAAVAASYEDDRALFGAMRAATPEPPRDLWARTAAVIEADTGGRTVRRASGHPEPSRRRFGPWQLAPVAALTLTAVVVGVALLPGAMLVADNGATAAATPIALTAGNVQVVSYSQDGEVMLNTQVVDEVCPLMADPCLVEPQSETAPLMALAGSDPLDAILSPDRDRIAVIQHSDDGAGVYVVAMAAPTPVPAATPTVTAPALTPDVPSPTAPPATPDVRPSATVTPAPTPSAQPVATPGATGDTAVTPAPETPAPTAEPTPAPTPEPPPAATPEPTATIAVTPMSGGLVKIASDVVVVGSAAGYDRKGDRFAFSARPADGSSGPNVYVWSAGDSRAEAVTTDGRSVFTGWQGGHLLVSSVVDGVPGTYRVDPVSGADLGDRVGAAWRPTVGPDGDNAVWWDGDVSLAADDVTWVPGKGRLVLGPWGRDGSTQVLSDKAARDWKVRWDADGTVLAVWLAGDKASDPGRLSVYRVDRRGNHAILGETLLDNEPAGQSFSLETGRLVWSPRAGAGDSELRILDWSGDEVGSLTLKAESGATIVQP